jgi:hypothetical protein
VVEPLSTETLAHRLQRYLDRLLWWVLPWCLYRRLPDHCETCGGSRGGVRGNENIVESCGERLIMCDYCTVDEHRWPGFWKEQP